MIIFKHRHSWRHKKFILQILYSDNNGRKNENLFIPEIPTFAKAKSL